MAKYHINDKGEAGLCSAKKSCPFGDLQDDHYTTATGARKAAEAKAGGSFSKPVSKSTGYPELQGVTPYNKILDYDYEAEVLKVEARIKKAKDDKEALGTINKATEAWKAERATNIAREARRASIVFSSARDNSTARAIIESGVITEHTHAPTDYENKKAVNFGNSVALASGDVKRRFYELPTKYYDALASEGALQSKLGFKTIVTIADEVSKNDPSFLPTPVSVTPRTIRRYHTNPSRPGEAADMQKIDGATYALLERYINDKLGAPKNDEFWSTLKSNTTNKPKLSDFVKHLKSFGVKL